MILRERSQKMQAAADERDHGNEDEQGGVVARPGTPAPSAPQKVPKEVSMTPTANFIAVLGHPGQRGPDGDADAATSTSGGRGGAESGGPMFLWLSRR